MNIYPPANGNYGELVASYKYVLRMDGKVVWEGLDPTEKIREIEERYPNAKIGIEWVRLDDDDLLIAPAF